MGLIFYHFEDYSKSARWMILFWLQHPNTTQKCRETNCYVIFHSNFFWKYSATTSHSLMSTTNSIHGNENKRLSVDEQLNVFFNHFVSFVFNENQIRVTKSQKKRKTRILCAKFGGKKWRNAQINWNSLKSFGAMYCLC